MDLAVDCDLFQHADGFCLGYQYNDVKEIEQKLNKNFSNICDWLLNNELNIRFGDDETKRTLLAQNIN